MDKESNVIVVAAVGETGIGEAKCVGGRGLERCSEYVGYLVIDRLELLVHGKSGRLGRILGPHSINCALYNVIQTNVGNIQQQQEHSSTESLALENQLELSFGRFHINSHHGSLPHFPPTLPMPE